MKRVFADTSFYQALFGPRERRHAECLELLDAMDLRVITTEYILVELGALLSRGHERTVYVNFIMDLRIDSSTEIIPASPALFEKGFDLFSRRLDKDWSITDCISFVVMNQLELHDALTLDAHFSQAGYNLLLPQ